MGKAIRESSFGTRSGKSSKIGNAYLQTEKKGLFLSVYVDDIKLAGKNQNFDPMWKTPMKEVDMGEPTSFLDHVYLGCIQTRIRNEQKYCGQLQKYVRIQDLCKSKRKATQFGET